MVALPTTLAHYILRCQLIDFIVQSYCLRKQAFSCQTEILMWKWVVALDRLLRGERGRSPTLLSAAALLLPVAGAVGSVGLMLRVGHRNDSRILLALFAICVLSPFVALVLANMISRRWSVLTRATLQGVMLILTVGSLAIYGNMVSTPSGSKLAVPFLVVPLGSWLLITIVIPMAALL